MDKSDIISLPNGYLRKPSKKVALITEKVVKLAFDMEKATLSWEDSRQHEVGVALAAVQVGCLERVIIIRNNFNDKTDRTFQIFINPEIIKQFGDLIEDYEGCLSIKNTYGKVPRYSKVRIKAKNIEDKEVRLTAEGFLARVFQHEIDHTKGIVFIDHIKDNPEAFYTLENDGTLQKKDYLKNIKNNKSLWG